METFKLHQQLQQDCIELLDFPLSKLLLLNDKNYPWFVLVPRVADVKEIFQLDWQDQQQLLNESSLLAELLATFFNADKLNIAALGNMVEQLHIHHIVRYKNDACWPAPVWGKLSAITYSEDEINDLKAKLLPQLTSILAK